MSGSSYTVAPFTMRHFRHGAIEDENTMRFTLLRLACTALLLTTAFLIVRVSAADPSWHIISDDTYASFVRNWNDGAQPVFCATIRSKGDWKTVFAPAVTMGNKRPIMPPDEFFTQNDLFVVAKVEPPFFASASPWRVNTLDTRDGTVILDFDFAPVSQMAGGKFKHTLIVSAPKPQTPPHTAIFRQSGTEVCRVVF